MAKKFITLHIVNDIPWSNLNRDDTGTPKRTILGGVERGLLSSQSLKRAARKDFENRTLKLNPEGYSDSYRSRNLADLVIDRASKIAEKSNVAIDAKKLKSKVGTVLRALTGAKEGKETITWLSFEELETLASIVVDDFSADEIEKLSKAKNPGEAFKKFMKERGVTGSLAIAAFGRMFASATPFQTEAAIAVSPAISTHGSIIEADYFIAADDYISYEDSLAGAGAAHLGVALYTSGVFYRTITIDVEELWFNWSGRDAEYADVQLEQFLKSLIYTLPTGKKNSTAPYAEPLLVLVEEQDYRQAFSISAPILDANEEGFKGKTIEMLKSQFAMARRISNDNYGRAAVSGTMSERFGSQIAMDSLITGVISWMNEEKPENNAQSEENNSENNDQTT